jgi:hypothetical protein
MAIRISTCWRRYALLTIAEILLNGAGSPQGQKQNPAEVGPRRGSALGTRRYELHPSPLLNDPLFGTQGACRRPCPRLWNQEWAVGPRRRHGAADRPWGNADISSEPDNRDL